MIRTYVYGCTSFSPSVRDIHLTRYIRWPYYHSNHVNPYFTNIGASHAVSHVTPRSSPQDSSCELFCKHTVARSLPDIFMIEQCRLFLTAKLILLLSCLTYGGVTSNEATTALPNNSVLLSLGTICYFSPLLIRSTQCFRSNIHIR